MRLLVFCGNRAAIEKFDMAGWPILVPIFGAEQRKEVMRAFYNDPDGKLAVLGKFMITGWRAPEDSMVLFDSSWPYGPDSPEWRQAAARRTH